MYEVANGSIVVAGKVLNAQLPVIQTGIEPIAAQIIEYAGPMRVNTNAPKHDHCFRDYILYFYGCFTAHIFATCNGRN